MSLSGILDMGRRALELAQLRVQTTAHNISNADTEAYSRQRVESTPTRPRLVQGGLLGTGARPESIERVTSTFLEHQLLTEKQSRGQLDLLATALSHVEEVLSEAQVGGLSSAITEFFNTWQELAVNPEGVAERQAVVAQGVALARQFGIYTDAIDQVAVDTRSDLESSVEKINTLAAKIADTNQAIVSAEAGGNQANDLRDMRNRLLGQLADLTEFTVVETGDPLDFTVQVKGQTVVQGVQSLDVAVVNDEQGLPTLAMVQGGVTSRFFELPDRGRVGAALRVIRTDVPQVQEGLNEIAVFLAANVNALHQQGYALDETTNQRFFESPLSVAAGSGNTGGATASEPTVADAASFTGHDYQIQFTAPDTYQVVDTTSGATVVAASAGNYSSGAAISFDGLEVTLTDATGPPAAGDTFAVTVDAAYASGIAVDATIESHPEQVVAAGTQAGLPGDNTIAKAIAGLAQKGTMGGGTTTFIESVAGLVSQAGVDSAQAQQALERQELVVQQVQAQREAVSGVSLDEEAANLVEFQRSYQAAAKVIATADKMLETLLNM